MYRLLIADDEELIRKGLISRLDYLGLKFQEIYQAGTGVEALERIQTSQIDIAITDIRMPDMDGLNFIAKAKEKRPGMKFIILSGYAEFEYAEEAIKLGVKGYMLKPISNDELQNVILQVWAQLGEEEGTRKAMFLQNKLISENRAFTLDKEVNALLSMSDKTIISMDMFKNLQRFYPEFCKPKSLGLYLILISVDRRSYGETGFHKEDIDLVRYAVKNVFQDMQTSCSKLIVDDLSNPSQLYAVLGNANKERIRVEVERFFLKMRSVFEEELGVYLTFGVSGFMSGLCSEAVQQADDALRGRLVFGRSNIYFYDDIETIQAIDFPSSQLIMLNQYLQKRDISNVKATVIDIFGKERLRKYHIHYIRIMWVRIINLIFRNFSLELLERENAAIVTNCFSMVNKTDDVGELVEYYMDIVMICSEQSENIDANARDKIKLAVSYISRHYAEDIPINRLAEKYDMSPNYFSSLFKKEMDQSTVNYIVNIRMQQAKQFLLETDKSVTEIAKAVGYEDSHYFYRVFKKSAGITPIRYRQLNKVSQIDAD